jgi:hypothetical protein
MRAARSARSVAGSSGGRLGRATAGSVAAPGKRFPPVAQRHVISRYFGFPCVGGRAAETVVLLLIARVRPPVESGSVSSRRPDHLGPTFRPTLPRRPAPSLPPGAFTFRGRAQSFRSNASMPGIGDSSGMQSTSGSTSPMSSSANAFAPCRYFRS